MAEQNALISSECTRRQRGGKGTSHGKCPRLSRTDVENLATVCLCSCHTAVDLPAEPPSYARAARMRADWKSGMFRLADLARRYGVPLSAVQNVIYSHKHEV